MASKLIENECRTGSEPIDTDILDSRLREAAKVVRDRVGTSEVAVVLGSGLGTLVDELKDKKSVSFSDIPHMPTSGVVGHAGEILTGYLGENKVLCFAGRVHAYEGYEPYELCFHARLMAYLGVKLLMTSNAAGTTMRDVKPGSIVELFDVVNSRYENPVGDVARDGRFVPHLLDTSAVFSKEIHKVSKVVRELPCFTEKEKEFFRRGVYSWNSGPSYETPQEVQAANKFGVTCVGMSTIPEVLAAHSLGIKVYAVSLVTNYGAGLSVAPLDHKEVKEMAKIAGPLVARFFREIISRLEVKSWPEITLPPKFEVNKSNVTVKLPWKRGLTLALDLPEKAVKGAQWLRSKLGTRLGSKIKSLLVLGPGFAENNVDNGTFTDVGVCLADIPGIPEGGDAAAKLYLVKDNLAVGCTWESGLHEDEAVFIAAVARELGATSVGCALCVGTLNPDVVELGSSIILSDTMTLLEFSSATPPPIWRYHGDGSVTFDMDQDRVVANVTGDENHNHKYGYAPVDGPALPHPIVCKNLKTIGVDTVGVFSVSCCRAAQRLAMLPIMVGLVAYEAVALESDVPRIPVDSNGFGSTIAVSGENTVDVLLKTAATTTESETVKEGKGIAIAVKALLSVESAAEKNSWLGPFAGTATQVKPSFILMAMNEVVKKLSEQLSAKDREGLQCVVEEARRFRHIRSWLERADTPAMPDDYKGKPAKIEPIATADAPWPLHAVGIVVDPRLGQLWENIKGALEDLHIVDGQDIPFCPGGLMTGRLGGRRVWVVRGAAYDMVADLTIGARCVPIRVLDYLGVTSLVLMPAVTPATDGVKPGHVVKIVDHINQTGQSPLFGENHRSHGKRFMDMSTAYAPELNALHDSVHDELGGGSMASVVVLFTRLAHWATQLELAFARHIGAAGLVASCVPECTVARHCLMQSTSIGVSVTNRLGLSSSHAQSLAEASDRAIAHLKAFLSGLEVVRSANMEAQWIEEKQEEGSVPKLDEEKGYVE